MAKPRRRLNMAEKLAASLCEIHRGGVWLIPQPLRTEGTAKEICAAVDFDHVVPWTWTHDNRPQNLTPMLRADHREKTRTKDIAAIAKVRRGLKKRAAKVPSKCERCKDWDRLGLSAYCPSCDPWAKAPRSAKPKRPMPYTAAKATHKRDFRTGKVERRT